MKRTVSVFAALIIALALPFSALAHYVSPVSLQDDADPDVITGVTLTGVVAPVTGEQPSYNVVIPAGSDYTIDYSQDGDEFYIKNGVQWCRQGTPVPFDGEFDPGTGYTVQVFLKAKPGKTFADLSSIAASVNGASAEAGRNTFSSDVIYVTYTFPETDAAQKTEILSVVFTGTVKYGTPLGPTTVVTSSDGILSASVSWLAGTEELDPGTPAVNGTYTVRIAALTDDAHVFTSETVFRALGSEGAPYQVAEDGSSAVYIADFTVACDHSGNTNDYFTDDEQHVLVCSVCGETVESGAHEFDGGVDTGSETEYTCAVCGYHYSVSHGTTGKINVDLPSFHAGDKYRDIADAVIVSFENGAPSNVIFTFTAGEDTEVIIFSVTAGHYMLPGGGDVDEALEKTVVPYADFVLTLEIEPSLAVQVSDVTVTGGPEPNISVSENGNLVILLEYGAFSNMISQIEFSSAPGITLGQKPQTAVTVSTEGVAVDKVEWFKNDEPWSADEKTVCVDKYVVRITLSADNGLSFAPDLTASPDALNVSVYGNTATLEYSFGGGDHSFGRWQTVNSAKEGVEGKKMRKCSVCGAVEYMTVPALEHTHKYVQKSSAEGHWTECSCGDKTEILAHEWGEWNVVTESDIGVEGEREHVCTVCGYKESEVIPALDPPHVHIYGLEYDEQYHWGRCECGDLTDKEEHEFDEDGRCAMCGYVRQQPAELSEEEPSAEGSEPVSEETDGASSTATVSEPEIVDKSGQVGLIIAIVFIVTAGAGVALWLFMKKKNAGKA
ncbi:MAG: hypothetical protein IJK33_03170 [Clostridia bacterium]|nr:hypothetical protein [Clostridia bacterium]